METQSKSVTVRQFNFKRRLISRTTVAHILAYALMVLWFHTGYDKLADLQAFRVSLGRQPLPGWSVEPLVYAVPLTEFFAGLLLLTRPTRRAGFWVSLLLMAAFTGYVALGLAGTLGRLPCSCSKIISQLSWKQHLYFNTGFLLAAGVGLLTVYPRWRVRLRRIRRRAVHFFKTKRKRMEKED